MGRGARAFRNEIKGGPKAELHFQFCKSSNLIEALLVFDIVGKHECKLLSGRPTWPAFLGPLGPGHDWPNVPNSFALALH